MAYLRPGNEWLEAYVGWCSSTAMWNDLTSRRTELLERRTASSLSADFPANDNKVDPPDEQAGVG